MYYGERFNSITHLIGTLLAILGAIMLIKVAAHQGDHWKLISFSIFGATMILLYAASTLYHSIRGAKKRLFAKLDHCAIYLLIAGTYTPFGLVTLRDAWGLPLLVTVWGLAIYGILRELFWGRHAPPCVPLYAVMGWLCVVVTEPLLEKLSIMGVVWLAIGLAHYTVGIIFYLHDERWRHSHGVWHLFVLGGSASHYYTVLNYVA
ncbi:hemolysin III family protein [Chitinivorax sp. B]|uniref:PAQR family membrane homeostasis protein TrhA n=1 Tax=Chitinivorax sp. B TaxID=2502235 RepID=UPI0010F8A159|nr:hemolysin III family protein [Chitinivorax sp. B]